MSQIRAGVLTFFFVFSSQFGHLPILTQQPALITQNTYPLNVSNDYFCPSLLQVTKFHQITHVSIMTRKASQSQAVEILPVLHTIHPLAYT